MKKKLIQQTNLFLVLAFILFLLSLTISFLYMMDWIGSTVFLIFCQCLGVFLYAMMGFFLCRLMPKRIMILALVLVALMLILYCSTQTFILSNFLFFLGKLMIFLAVILFVKGKAK